MSVVSITTRDRLIFCLFVAISIHAALILGLGFTAEMSGEEQISIDVTLSVASDALAPEQADFIAATNQLGSGTEAEVQDMTTTERADFKRNELNPVMSQPTPKPEVTERTRDVLTTQADVPENANDDLRTMTELLAVPDTNQLDRAKLVQEIASLEARIAKDRQILAKMPRTKRISSVTTRSASEAAYLNMWRQRCERIGRANYPAGSLEGEVLMLVSILADGTLEEVRILKSSGHKQLDRAALATVKQAAPYQPFNLEMRKSYDRLEFTRTWQFTKSGSSAS